MEQIRSWYQKYRQLKKKHCKFYRTFSKILCCVNHSYKKRTMQNPWELVFLQYFIIQIIVFPARYPGVSILNNFIPSSFPFNTEFMKDPLSVRKSSSNAFCFLISINNMLKMFSTFCCTLHSKIMMLYGCTILSNNGIFCWLLFLVQSDLFAFIDHLILHCFVSLVTQY